jgi:hypothetical protein
MPQDAPNFALLDMSHREVASLVVAMVQACEAVALRSWSLPQEPITDAWWADVLADPRARQARAAHRSSSQASVLSARR